MVTKEDIQSLRSKYEQIIGRQNSLKEQLASVSERLCSEEKVLSKTQKARIIVQTVAELTQKKIEYHISNLVTLALASVFPDPYKFVIRFVQRRNRTEADLVFIKNDNEGTPIDISGGGPLDVASFALRASIWSIKPTRNVLILDEPFGFVSRDLQYKCSEMVKMISEKLNVQIIMVSHIPELIAKADKVVGVTNKGGISYTE